MMRVCPEPGCPELVDKGRCAQHRRDAERARGSREERGYGAEHQQRRYVLERARRRGLQMVCAKCSEPISEDQPWHLGHTDDRSNWTGPEHVLCNLSAAGHARWRDR